MKKCSKCGIEKNESEFGKLIRNKDGLNSWCKACVNDNYQKWCNKNKLRLKDYKQEYYKNNSEKAKEYQKEWHKNNSEKVKEYQKEYYKNNSEKVKEYKQEYYKNNFEKAKEAAKQWRISNPDYSTEWYKNNPEKAKEYKQEYSKNRRADDNNFKLLTNLRSRIRLAIKSQYGDKAYKSIELLGCSIEEARLHLESLFQPGMTWDNYGMFGWHIDHIIPCDAFDLTDPEEQKKCFHYTNLQPLWAEDNLKKSNKIISL